MSRVESPAFSRTETTGRSSPLTRALCMALSPRLLYDILSDLAYDAKHQRSNLTNFALKHRSCIKHWPTSRILFSLRNISLIFNSSSLISLAICVFASISTENTKHTSCHMTATTKSTTYFQKTGTLGKM